MKIYLSLLLSGLLLACSFPKPALFPLAWCSLVPLLGFLMRPTSLRRLVTGHFLFFVPFFGTVLYWIVLVIQQYGGLSWPVAGGVFALLVVTLAGFMLPMTLSSRWICTRTNPETALGVVPALWCGCELLRNHVGAGGFPWAALGYSQVPFAWFLQAADIGGVYLLSFLLVAFNCGLVLWWRGARFRAGVGFALCAAAIVYGAVRPSSWEGYQEGTRRVTLVQPGVNLRGSQQYFRTLYFDRLPEDFRDAAAKGVDWVFFPEAPNPYSPDREHYFKEFWGDLVSDAEVPILLNATGRSSSSADYFNSMFVVDEQGRFAQRYDKRKLVPFGEFIPWGGFLLGFSGPLVQGVSHFTHGNKTQTIPIIDGIPFGMLICYESIFPELSRGAAQEGAQFLVNVTNDRWFGNSAAPLQHLQMAVLRAVEQRKPLLRAANHGISAWIDARGTIRSRLDLFETGTMEVVFRPNSYRSIDSYIGSWATLSLILVSTGWVTWRIRTWKRKGTTRGRLS